MQPNLSYTPMRKWLELLRQWQGKWTNLLKISR